VEAWSKGWPPLATTGEGWDVPVAKTRVAESTQSSWYPCTALKKFGCGILALTVPPMKHPDTSCD
jgi:hypothetical protein